AGLPIISYILSNVKDLNPKEIRVVVGHGKNIVQTVVQPLGAQCYVQEQQLGTGHAVMCANPESLEGTILILNGDHPLIQTADLKRFIKEFEDSNAGLGLLTAKIKDPGSYGRVIRHNNELRAIVEAKHAGQEALKINEVNSGIYLIKADILKELIQQIEVNPEKNEFYLTDIIELCHEATIKMVAVEGNPRVAFGVNSQVELAQATKSIFQAKTKTLMDEGVIILDPAATYVEPTVQVGAGSVLYPGVFLKGLTKLGACVVVEPNAFIINSDVHDNAQVRAGSYLEDCVVKSKAVVGPYARLRPNTEIGEDAKVGNFVEMKKVKFGKGSKAGHLTYLGDAEIGENVNIGCGTITCNYAADKNKYKTKIGDNVFVGSDTQFVAPITVGDSAVIGSGSTITKDVPAYSLAVARGKQFIKENYVKKDDKE
ncbi:MAG: bifunctional UDP-N-acetylglucosamine diphosphorylase/glucosamine-1-phosphate N-acetyltransferase GlmU, partial [Bdellovibrionales bacterium]|nr:bifunctional UDP-N-acetylglucosamine diphosphorylase/glucosamine-1-phosphate N-acetyltransferase GlmU [Bdellovibrionales bacterium]